MYNSFCHTVIKITPLTTVQEANLLGLPDDPDEDEAQPPPKLHPLRLLPRARAGPRHIGGK